MSLPPLLWPTLVTPDPITHSVRDLLSLIGRKASDQSVVVEAVKQARLAGDDSRPPARTLSERPTSGRESLTASELRVATLVDAGHTNRAIASRLQVSVHTVSTHLRHVFTKLDINTRVELTRVSMQRSAEGHPLPEA